MKKCPICNRKYSDTDNYCYNDNYPLVNFDPNSESIKKEQNVPKCPTCGSTNVNKISTAKKAAGFLTVGVFSSNLGKAMECKNCGYKW